MLWKIISLFSRITSIRNRFLLHSTLILNEENIKKNSDVPFATNIGKEIPFAFQAYFAVQTISSFTREDTNLGKPESQFLWSPILFLLNNKFKLFTSIASVALF